jgi:leader peptidase (prepilin peptidase)/N-methyltransferase
VTAAAIFEWLKHDPLAWIGLAVLGACLGSFVNVVIYRLPRDLSLVWPRSRCPHCAARIAPYDNVPLLSYALLRGRCRSCHAPITPRYPVVEALGALLTPLAVITAPTLWLAILNTSVALALLAVLFIDYDHKIIPDVITLPGAALGLLAAFLGPRPVPDSLEGIAVGAGGLLAIALLYRLVTGREGLGLGDVKLMAMVGAVCGWQGALTTVVLASLAGSLVGVSLILGRRGNGQTALPFGSFLAPAAWVVLFAGGWLWQAYLGLATP